MARQYSGKRGKHGSKKPVNKAKPTWVSYADKEVEQLVVKLAKTGKTTSQIGLTLRDSYGIPDVKVITGKKITKIVEENKLLPNIPEDVTALMKKEINLMKHLEKNKHDMTAKRGLQLSESRIHRLSKYYKRIGKLPADWKYDKESIKLIIG